MIKKLNVGIIGLGVGLNHLQCFIQNKNCRVISVCDFDEEKIKVIQSKFPKIKTTLVDKDITEDKNIDLVCIASYDIYHCDQLITSVKNNKHVFVEKPLCTNYKEFIKIKEILKKNPKIKISSNFILRGAPQFIALNRMIEKKKFGKIFYISGEYNYGRLSKIINGWRSNMINYSVTHGGAIHIIDLALSFLKKKPKEVVASGNNISTAKTNFKSNDIINSTIKFEDNTIVNITSNFGCVMPHHHTFKLYGTERTFIQDYKRVYVSNSRQMNNKIIKINDNYLNKNKKKILESFIDSLVSKKKPLVSQNDVISSMAISLAIDKSVKSNKWEKIRY